MKHLAERKIGPFLDRLRRPPFIDRVEVGNNSADAPPEGLILTITDRQRRPFRFRGDLKTSYLDRSSVNSLIANARLIQKRTREGLLVLARYIPLPTGEQLIAAGINFVDLVGNMHLVLGDHYERTIVGHVESQRPKEKQPATAAQMQLLFLFATQPESVTWPVREIARHAGVSKSKAAAV